MTKQIDVDQLNFNKTTQFYKFRSSGFFTAMLLLCVGAVALAMSGIFVRTSQVPPTMSALYRVLIATPFLWFLIYTQPENHKESLKISKKAYLYFILSGIFLGLDLALWHWSITFTSIANANLFANMAPIVVVLGSFFIFKERFNSKFICGLIVAIVGSVILLAGNYETSFKAFEGDLLGLGTAVFYGAYILSISSLRRFFGTFTIMFWSALGCLIVLFPITLILNHRLLLPLTISGYLALLALGLGSHIGGQGLVAYALKKLPASFSSVTLLVQPIFAAIFAWVLLSEKLGFLEIFGCIVVLLGIYFTTIGYKPKFKK